MCRFCLFVRLFVCLLITSDLKDDLEFGSLLIWGGLGVSNVVSVICCAIYMFKKIEWQHAIQETTKRLRQTIDSTKET